MYERITGGLATTFLLSVWMFAPSLAVANEEQRPELGYTFQDCNSANEEKLRTELNRLAQEAIKVDSNRIQQIVNEHWSKTNMDRVFDREVDKAIEEIASQEDYLSRLWSTWSPEKAKELTTKVAQRTFNSPGFTQAIDDYSKVISAEFVEAVRIASQRSASVALRCMQTHVGEKYSKNLVTLFGTELRQKFSTTKLTPSTPDLPAFADHSKTFVGIGAIIGAYIGKKLIERLVRRIAGRIVGRILGKGATTFIPVVGWVVGTGLIVWDLVEGGQGAFPHIETALKSQDAKADIRFEIAKIAQNELSDELPGIARQVADEVFGSWQELKRQITNIIRLADKDPEFKKFLGEVPPSQVYRLSRQVEIYIELKGKKGLSESFASGSFQRIFWLPEGALDILSYTRSIDDVASWYNLSGPLLTKVAKLEIYKSKKHDEISRSELEKLTLFEDKSIVADLLLLDKSVRDALLSLSSSHLEHFARRLEFDELRWLGLYVRDLPQEKRDALLRHLRKDASLMSRLKSDGVKREITSSEQVDTVLKFVGREPSWVDGLNDVGQLFSGALSVDLFWHRYGQYKYIALTIIGLLLLYLFLRRR